MKWNPKLALLLAALCLQGCELRQQMYVQQKYRPLGKSDFFADQRMARPLPENVVPRGKDDDHLYKGMVDGKPVTTFPFPIGKAEIERGMSRYNIYCSPCHSRTGDGWGMVVQRGFKRPPSFHEARLKGVAITHFFNVITNGLGMMSGYSAQIPAQDRWAIIAYIKALQLSQDGRIADVPEGERVALEASK